MPDAGAHEDRLTLLRAAQGGSDDARRSLLGLCYTELRRLAHRLLRGDAAARPLQPTELLHEAATRVLDLERLTWRDRAHFLALAAPIMRQALIDEVRRVRAGQRAAPAAAGSDTAASAMATATITTLYDPGVAPPELDVESLDGALRELQRVDAQRARIVELRFFAGLSVDESAAVLGLEPASVKRRWDSSRAWLQQRLAQLPALEDAS